MISLIVIRVFHWVRQNSCGWNEQRSTVGGFSKETLWGCLNTHREQSLTSFWAKEAAGSQEALELGTVKISQNLKRARDDF